MVLTFEEYNVIDAAERCRELPRFRSGGDRDSRGQGIAVSVPGGMAYKHVMKRLANEDKSRGTGAATVWFAEELVYGQTGPDGWIHPFTACGRDEAPVPEGSRDAMWDAHVEGAGGISAEPEAGRRYKCWCCKWLAATDQWHADGFQLYCVTSNVFEPEWVERYGAGSSELATEEFENARPAGWGSGAIVVEGSEWCEGPEFEANREARIHPDTGLPLGNGCRWERQCMDKKPYEVRCFFLP
uniref:Uncharacterized protein n=1 Tax=Alexandrium monilatum TaxID=311494 RepID=A0A7S4WK45_9DINO|eukprot:CAMPEP_0175497800 /NCGR_PEP_ID=MMETSP0096-20121207/4993_1 /TAXON_ID=311494 /ORGANISM="Alexandrium monilatum, Strain CCMP3105" /LENGTH=241 /DNA_ID=CAMNT_0016799823 /DNA_START=40 /DNA_END=762 /DNA_ORIENTATION=+